MYALREPLIVANIVDCLDDPVSTTIQDGVESPHLTMRVRITALRVPKMDINSYSGK